MQQVEANF